MFPHMSALIGAKIVEPRQSEEKYLQRVWLRTVKKNCFHFRNISILLTTLLTNVLPGFTLISLITSVHNLQNLEKVLGVLYKVVVITEEVHRIV